MMAQARRRNLQEPAASIHYLQLSHTQCTDTAAAGDGTTQNFVMHQYQAVIAHGHDIKLDRPNTE